MSSAATDPREIRAGTFAAAAAAILFGTAFVATAFALRSFTPLAAATWRGGLSLAGLGALMALGVIRPPRLHAERPEVLVRVVLLGILGGPVTLLGINLAVAGAGATIAAFATGLYAVLAALIAPLILRERMHPVVFVAFVVALAGVALLSGFDPTRSSVGGIAAGLVAATSFAFYLVLSRKWSSAYGLEAATLVIPLVASQALVIGAITLATAPATLIPHDAAPIALVAMLWIVVGPSIGGNMLAAASVRRIPARRTSALLLLNPLTAAVLSFVLLGESPTTNEVVGGLLVLGGMAVATGAASAVRRAAARALGRPGPVGDEPDVVVRIDVEAS